MRRHRQKRVIWDDPDHDAEALSMQFRLLYSGPLYATSQGNRRVQNKHLIRQALHPQLRRLWAISPTLNTEPLRGFLFDTRGPSGPREPHTVEALSRRFNQFKYNFVPLVTEEIALYCELDILFLRFGLPGGLVKPSGDIDNRMKTLFDALSKPDDGAQIPPKHKDPSDDEHPFYCLLQNDKLVTKLSVETDTLLKPEFESGYYWPFEDEGDEACQSSEEAGKSEGHVHLVITVRLHPIAATIRNMGFG